MFSDHLFAMRNSSTVAAALQISYDQFLDLVEAGTVEQVNMNDDQIQITLNSDVDLEKVWKILGTEELPEAIQGGENFQLGNIVFYTGRVNDQSMVSILRENNVRIYEGVPEQASIFSVIISFVLPMVIMYLFYLMIIRMFMKRMGDGEGGIMGGLTGGIGKSKAKVYIAEKSTGVTFQDVAGQDEENNDCATNDGGTWLYHEYAGGRTVLAHKGRTAFPDYHVIGWSCRRACSV